MGRPFWAPLFLFSLRQCADYNTDMATFNFLKMEYWTTEPEALAWFDFLCKDAKLIVDVGAEIGYYTKRAMMKAPITCQVHAYEPDPEAYAILMDGVEEWKLRRLAWRKQIGHSRLYWENNAKPGGVVVQEKAVTLPDTKSVKVHLGKKSSRCRDKAPPWATSSHEVTALSLDDMYLERDDIIDILKIDTEGDEFNVIKGAAGMLKHHRIKNVMLEIHYPMISKGEGKLIRQTMSGYGYHEIPIETPGSWEDNGNIPYLYTLNRGLGPGKTEPERPPRCSECMSLVDPKKLKERKARASSQGADTQED